LLAQPFLHSMFTKPGDTANALLKVFYTILCSG
jgi:hypothetical protein